MHKRKLVFLAAAGCMGATSYVAADSSLVVQRSSQADQPIARERYLAAPQPSIESPRPHQHHYETPTPSIEQVIQRVSQPRQPQYPTPAPSVAQIAPHFSRMVQPIASERHLVTPRPNIESPRLAQRQFAASMPPVAQIAQARPIQPPLWGAAIERSRALMPHQTPAAIRPTIDRRKFEPNANSTPITLPTPTPTPPAMNRFAPHIRPILDRAKMIWDDHKINYPAVDDRGLPISSRPLVHAPDFRNVLQNGRLTGHLERDEKKEIARNTHHWHHDSDGDYDHYVDNWGDHRYGFYNGSSFFWVRRHLGRWSWHDPVFNRWTYWNNGHWCWQDPRNPEVIYVIINNNYYPIQDGTQVPVETVSYADTTQDAVPDAVQSSVPALQDDGVPTDFPDRDTKPLSYYSKDQTRLVQISGADHRAELFDVSNEGEPRFIAALATGVEDVQFFNQDIGSPIDVLVFLKGGSFLRFDGQGRDLD